MSIARIAALGHSHLLGLMGAYDRIAERGNAPFTLLPFEFIRKEKPWLIEVNGRYECDPKVISEAQRTISELKPDVQIFLLQGEHAILSGLVWPEPEYQFFFPGDETLYQASSPNVIPYDLLIESHTRSDLEIMIDLLSSLTVNRSIPSFALSPPPPLADQTLVTEHVLRHLRGYPFAEIVKERGVPPAEWRLKVWKLVTAAMAVAYRKNGVVFLEPPTSARDESGCLLSSLSRDAIHANEDYYEQVIEQLCKAIS